MHLCTVLIVSALLAVALGSAFGSLPVYAISGNFGLLNILNQSKAEADQKIAQLQDAGITVPDNINAQYAQGVSEYQAALAATDISVKDHAFKAMIIFKGVIEAAQGLVGTPADEANQAGTLLQSVADSEAYAQKIRVVALANGLSDSSFSDYNTAIGLAKSYIANGNFDAAQAQISTAQELLDKIYLQLENQAELKMDSRASQFLKDTIATLTKMIDNAKALGLSQSTIDELQGALDRLQNSSTTNQIIDNADQSSTLENATDLYNNQRVANFQKESVRLQHEISVLQQNADSMNLQLSGLVQIQQTFDDIKEKIANGQLDDATGELDQEDSLIANMNDVINGAPAIINEINNARTLATSLQSQAQTQNNNDALGNISQAMQILDSANAIVANATSSSDLQSAKDTTSQAEDILNNVKDSLNSNQAISNETAQSTNTTNSTENTNQTNSSGNSTSSSNSTESSGQPSGSNSTG